MQTACNQNVQCGLCVCQLWPSSYALRECDCQVVMPHIYDNILYYECTYI